MFDRFRRLISGKGAEKSTSASAEKSTSTRAEKSTSAGADNPKPAKSPKLVPLKLTPRKEPPPAAPAPKVESPPAVEVATLPSPELVIAPLQVEVGPTVSAPPTPVAALQTAVTSAETAASPALTAPSESPTVVSASSPSEPPMSEAQASARKQAQEYLDRVQDKVNRLTDDFAEGAINRDQFRKLYEHYQRERKTIETLLASDVKTDELKAAISEGYSVVIRREQMAKAEGYAIYENESGMPLKTIGHFEVDPALVVPMLSSFRSATKEIFGAGLRSTEIESGKWMCFVPGIYTTMLAIFSKEPPERQQEFLEGLHRLFERANRHRLSQTPIDIDGLLFPHEFYSDQ